MPLRTFIVAICIAASLGGQRPAQSPPGDVYQTRSNPNGDVYQSGSKPGDVYQSGCDDDKRHYIRNGTFDRCAWDRAHYACNPLTAQCGMPEEVPISTLDAHGPGPHMTYLKCVVNACNSQTTVCWCPKERGYSDDTPLKKQDGRKDNPDRNDGNPRPNPINLHTDQNDRPCTLQKLAGLVMSRYGTGFPIGRVRVVNANQPTYMLLLPGMEWNKPGQATMLSDALVAWSNVEMLNAYRLAIMDAVDGLGRGTNLILVGHSQGGLEAQQAVKNLVERWGFKVPQVISFGAPIVANDQPGTNYLNVRAQDEPLQALDRRYALDPAQLVRSNPGVGNPLFGPQGSHNSYDKPISGLSRYGVPRVSTLTSPCYQLDLTTMQDFAVPDMMSRVVPKTNCLPAPAQPVTCRFPLKASLPAGACSGNPNDRGMLTADQNFLKRVSAEKCLVFVVRDSSPLALRWIGQKGYKPKPETIKGKTLKTKDMMEMKIPQSQWDQYLGLASARGMSQKDVQALWTAGYSIFGPAQLIVSPDGSKYYSDTDLHGVYDQNGNSAYSQDLLKVLQCGTTDSGIQHGPHDDWPFRNNQAAAKANYGPQIYGAGAGDDPNDPKTVTAILPDGRTICIRDLASMKQLYAAIGVNFNKIYPAF